MAAGNGGAGMGPGAGASGLCGTSAAVRPAERGKPGCGAAMAAGHWPALLGLAPAAGAKAGGGGAYWV